MRDMLPNFFMKLEPRIFLLEKFSLFWLRIRKISQHSLIGIPKKQELHQRQPPPKFKPHLPLQPLQLLP